MAQQTMTAQPFRPRQIWMQLTRTVQFSVGIIVAATLTVGALTFINRWPSVSFIALAVSWLTIFLAVCVNAIYKRLDSKFAEVKATIRRNQESTEVHGMIDDLEKYLRETDQ